MGMYRMRRDPAMNLHVHRIYTVDCMMFLLKLCRHYRYEVDAGIMGCLALLYGMRCDSFDMDFPQGI